MGPPVATANNPLLTSINSVTRAWNDVNGDYVPDCDLHNFGANGECGAISNANFGQLNPNARRYADDLIRGFGNRDYLWDTSVELQHQVSARMSLKGGWYSNWSDHFSGLTSGWSGDAGAGVIDNLAVTRADYDSYCITAPVDPRLPGGGGYQVCGLYDIRPDKFGVSNDVVTRASNFGGKLRRSHFFSGVINTRLGEGIELGASVDTGRTVEDNCYVVDSPQQLLNCRTVNPFSGQAQIKAHGSVPLPGSFVVSAVFQNLSGVPYEANYTVRNDSIAPSLGRNLAACGTRAVCTAGVTVPLIKPLTQFEPRRTFLDLRLTRIFALGGNTRVRANFDVYNALNDGSVVSTNNTYGPNWLQPVGGAFTAGLADGRLVQFSAQVTF
jgi:hypothetical protein